MTFMTTEGPHGSSALKRILRNPKARWQVAGGLFYALRSSPTLCHTGRKGVAMAGAVGNGGLGEMRLEAQGRDVESHVAATPAVRMAATVTTDVAEEPDARFMCRALGLAARGVGRTNPNPLVGAVIVRDGRVIGQGWHACYGQAHAERAALADCARRGEEPSGATVYVTLEPCAHQGKQPPCADALIEAGVARVVIGSRDPNPLVSGKGAARLEAAGIEVVRDVLRDECDAINQVFFHYITTKTPYVLAKWAMTADGRIACRNGDARWVSGPASRADAHALRNRMAAVMVGAGTVRADDPLLTCRLEGGRNPLRVVLDTELSLGLDSALVRSAAAGEAPLLVACGVTAEPAVSVGAASVSHDDTHAASARLVKADRLRALGVEVLELPRDAAGHVSLPALMAELGRRGVDSVLLEGGAHMHGSAFAAGLVDEAVAYVAPKLLGDGGAPGPVTGMAPVVMADAVRVGPPHVDVLGEDVRLCWRVEKGMVPAVGLPCVACGPLYPGGVTTAQHLVAIAKAGE